MPESSSPGLDREKADSASDFVINHVRNVVAARSTAQPTGDRIECTVHEVVGCAQGTQIATAAGHSLSVENTHTALDNANTILFLDDAGIGKARSAGFDDPAAGACSQAATGLLKGPMHAVATYFTNGAILVHSKWMDTLKCEVIDNGSDAMHIERSRLGDLPTGSLVVATARQPYGDSRPVWNELALRSGQERKYVSSSAAAVGKLPACDPTLTSRTPGKTYDGIRLRDMIKLLDAQKVPTYAEIFSKGEEAAETAEQAGDEPLSEEAIIRAAVEKGKKLRAALDLEDIFAADSDEEEGEGEEEESDEENDAEK